MFHIFKRKLRYYFISPLDKALDEHRQKNPANDAQQYEKNKYAKIARLRDRRPIVPSN